MTNGKILKALGTTLALVLGLAGAAYALQVETAALPMGSDFQVLTEFVPGSNGDGSIVCGGPDEIDFDDTVMLSIRFGADGKVSVNDVPGPAFVPGNPHRADIRFNRVGSDYFADIALRDLASGQMVYAAMGVDVNRPTTLQGEAIVSADVVTLLSVIPQ